jgi:hypothetical protein
VLQPPPPRSPIWPNGIVPTFTDISVAIARTQPEYDGEEEVREMLAEDRAGRPRSLETDRIDQQVADNREQERDQSAGDGNAGVQHPLEDLIDYIFLGDVASQRIADPLDVAFESLHLRALIIDFRPS